MKPGNEVVSDLVYTRVWNRIVIKVEVKHSVVEESSEQWLSQQVGAN